MSRTYAFSDADFFKSSASGNNDGSNDGSNCVAVAIKEMVAVRNSKDPTRTTLVFTHDEWRAFLAGVQNGEFNLPG